MQASNRTSTRLLFVSTNDISVGVGALRTVLGFIFFAPFGFVFLLANPLRLKNMECKRKSYMKPFTAKSATHGKLKQRKTG